MKPEDPLLLKAERYIRSGLLLADDGDLDSAASRLYYAMFYVADVLLASKHLSFSSHHAIIAAYGKEFAKTGEMDVRHHRALIAAFDRRTRGDYLRVSSLNIETIDEMVADAQAFLAEARQWLAAHPASDPNESQP